MTSISAQQFEALGESLREALAQQDWSAIAELDSKVREMLVEVLASEPWADHALQEQLNELVRLYEQLKQAGCLERERLGVELTRLNQSKQAANAYKLLE